MKSPSKSKSPFASASESKQNVSAKPFAPGTAVGKGPASGTTGPKSPRLSAPVVTKPKTNSQAPAPFVGKSKKPTGKK